MRRLTGLLAVGTGVMLTGCFDDDKLPGVPLKLELTARKDYRPSRWTDGVHSFDKDTKFKVPAKLDVVFGNSGNHKSYLFFKKAKDKKESCCEYKGGSSQSHPKGQKELDKAKVYRFVKCDGGLKADDVAVAKDLRLRLDNGGNEKESAYTIIKATILYAGAPPTPTPTVVVTPVVTPTPVVTATPTPSPTPDIFTGLPPDPGEAGKATVLGIDSDNDGVRDDIQRLIQQTAPNSTPIKSALRQYAANAQKLFAAVGNDSEVLRLLQESNRSSQCARYIMRTVDLRSDGLEVMDKLRANIANSYLRMKTLSEISSVASGKVIQSIPIGQESQACKFDINAR